MLTRALRTASMTGLFVGSSLLAAGCNPTLVGNWKVTSDVTAAGFATLELNSDSTYVETGRTDGQSEKGRYSEPATVSIDPSFGSPPAGMTGPYLQITTDQDGDGEWVYGYTLTQDSLTLTRYAQRNGMGLRWASVETISLSNQ